MRSGVKSLLLAAVLAAALVLPATSPAAPLGRVVALGDSLASGQWLGPQVPGSITECGQSTGGYPEVAMSRVTHGAWVNASCNGTTVDNFPYGRTTNSGTYIPPQYDSLNGNEDLVIVGTGSNEAFFGQIAYDCTGYQPAVNAFFHNRDNPEQGLWPIPNHCSDTYLVNGVSQIPNYVALSKSKIATALTQIHQRSPQAKILLIGTPRIAKPSGSACLNSEFWLTETDAPLYATWEDGVRQAMIDDVNAFNAAVPGGYAHYVNMQAISGTAHTACEPNWADRWMNPHTYQTGLQYPGIALHNTPVGASVMANAIVDAIHAQGFDTGATPADPVVSISSPASGVLTTNGAIAVNYSASDNIRVASCSFASGASVALSPGTNTIVVTCFDDAGNSGSDSITVKRDATPPTISISSPLDGSGTTASSAQLIYTASDDVGTPTCTPASGKTFNLAVGANPLSVSCTDSVGRVSSSSSTVYRGSPPVVAISSPVDGANTQSAAINVAYTVGGSAAIPAGTTCKVKGAASTSGATNSVALTVGANEIDVICTNLFGSGSAAVTVNRGNAPLVAIGSPIDEANTTANAINVAFSVNGASSIPAGTNCKVGVLATSSTTNNTVGLAIGPNAITVACTNQFGTGSAAVTVNRGTVPVAQLVAPPAGMNTASASVNVAFTVDGSASIPAGTTCTVGGIGTTSAATNPFALSIGTNTISVGCTNAFGSGPTASVTVNRGNAPAVAITTPAPDANTTAGSVNLDFTVDAGAAIPGGTTCTVGGTATSSATGNSVALTLGPNTISVACANSFGSGGAAVTVTRGVAPIVAILAPTNNALTSATSVNTAFTVNDATSIPAGTTCSVGGVPTSSAATNAVPLTLGSNTITVVCSSVFGTDSRSVTVVRGTGPTVVITAPNAGLNTTASTVNLAFTVGGAESIPSDTTCTVNGASTSNAEVNVVALGLGANTLEVTCTNGLGSDTQSVVVARGTPPTVEFTAPQDNAKTIAETVNVAFTVDGAASIPLGTDCLVAGKTATSATTNSAQLALGNNELSVACTNPFGTGTATVHVERGALPNVAITAPIDGLKTTAGAVNVAYTVDGAALLPAGTTCSVNSQPSANPSSNTVALGFGVSEVTVSCANAFGSRSVELSVERGTAPIVAITAPADGLKTAAEATTLSYTVDGTPSIPLGTSCEINGEPSIDPSSSSVALGLGVNSIAVACANEFGSSATASVSVTRGQLPVVTISAPSAGLKTSAASVSVVFSSTPTATGCTVDGNPASSPTNVALAIGAKTIAVACSNEFGTGPTTSVTVTRGNPPVVAISAPVDGTKTTASSISVQYSVDGAGTLPAGTTCTVGGQQSSDPSAASSGLALGTNSITVSCVNAFGSAQQSVSVTRGVLPTITLTSPANGLKTSAASVSVAFSTAGAPTGCNVGGVSSTSGPVSLPLALGSNTISASCSNEFGTGPQTSITVTRGNPPVLTITGPASGTNIVAASVNVSYAVDGQSAIPAETTCSVAGAASTSASNNVRNLTLGANTLTATCANPFGSGSASVTVNRGNAPVVAVLAPADGALTSSANVNVAFTVDGGSSIPAGTTCSVAGVQTTSTTTNAVALAMGGNAITVSCTNVFGAGSATVNVDRGNGPAVAIIAPASGLKTPATSVGVSFTVDGAASIPAGTSCKLQGATITGPATGTASLVLGLNVVTVICTNSHGSDTKSVTVERGNPPVVAITSPASDTYTTSDQANVTFTVDGVTSLPSGTTCTVGGQTATSGMANAYPLAVGANTIAVSCENAFGASAQRSVKVNRGSRPQVAINSPTDGAHTDATSIAIAFGVTGSGSPTCTLNGAQTTGGSETRALAYGDNNFSIVCSNAYGSSEPATLTVTRGDAPLVLINAAAHSETIAESVNATYSVDRGAVIPPGTTCSVNGHASIDPNVNLLTLAVGENTVSVTCTNPFASSTASVTVTYSPRPDPQPPTPPAPPAPAGPTMLKLKLGGSKLRPARRGGMLLGGDARGGLKLRVMTGAPATVQLQFEQLRGKKLRRLPRASEGTVELASGTTTIRLSGRLNKRALRPGRYRVFASIPGTHLTARSRVFRVIR